MANHPFGQHIIIGLHGTRLSDGDRRILKELQPAGLLFFTRNFDHAESYESWTSSFQDLLAEAKELTGRTSLLLSIDHEGGHVVRLPAPITKFPYAAQYGSHAFDVGLAMGKELASLGLNVSWAPVADVHSNPDNPVIGVRAFDTDPERAADKAESYLKGLHEAGIWGCAKHFPGHGDTSVDSHYGLPVQKQKLKQIRERELLPFRRLIQAKVPMVMTAHILFPEIDADETVTLSATFLKKVLREELAYEGVVVSDDLEMIAVRDRFLQPGALRKAFEAGNDMFIAARSPAASVDVADKVCREFDRAWKEEEIDESLLKASSQRVDALLDGLPQNTPSLLSDSDFLEHAKLSLRCSGV